MDKMIAAFDDFKEKGLSSTSCRALVSGLEQGALFGLFLTPVAAAVRRKAIVTLWKSIMPVAATAGAITNLGLSQSVQDFSKKIASNERAAQHDRMVSSSL